MTAGTELGVPVLAGESESAATRSTEKESPIRRTFNAIPSKANKIVRHNALATLRILGECCGLWGVCGVLMWCVVRGVLAYVLEGRG
eukprot:scaffold93248_cov71-Attheya_sp.AAC.1